MNFLKKYLRNKKRVVIIGIIMLLLFCFLIDYLISNFTNDELWIGDIPTSANNMGVSENNEEDNAENDNGSDDASNRENEDEFPNNSSEDSETSGTSSDLGDYAEDGSTKELTSEGNDVKDNSDKSNIYVYVTGEVNNPGVVTLKEGDRIHDAINAAGGVTSNADISKMNLVFILEDGMKVNIPSYAELKNNPDFVYITIGSGEGENNSWASNSNSNNYSDTITNSKNSYSSKIQVVNINTATQTELETLPGIGPSLALKIINYRKENGKFSNIEEIKNVSGIGDSKFNDIKDYITV